MNENSIVLDTNILFSALISKTSRIRNLLFNSNLKFYAPNYLIVEIYKYHNKLITNSKLSEEEFYFYFNTIIQKIRFVQIESISTVNRQKAYNLCKNVDLKDVAFVSLAIELNFKIWTGDKKLKAGLIKNGYNHFFEI